MLLNCGVGGGSWRVPWTARRSNQSILKKIRPNIHWKDWCWSWNSSTLSPDVKNWLIGKNPWCWERLKAGGERDDRGWDGWMASTTQWTWIRASSGSWWWTVKPGDAAVYAVTRVWHDWRTGLNWTVSVAVPLLTGTGFWELIVPLKWAMVEYLHDGNWQALQISLPAYH